MKPKWIILFLVALILFFVFAVILPQTGPSAEQKRLAQATATARAVEKAAFLTQQALPTGTPVASLSQACEASDRPVVLKGTLSFAVVVSTVGSGAFSQGSILLSMGDEATVLRGVPVCQFDKGVRKNCISFPPKDFESSDLTGFDIDGERFWYGDPVTVYGTSLLEEGACSIKLDHFINDAE